MHLGGKGFRNNSFSSFTLDLFALPAELSLSRARGFSRLHREPNNNYKGLHMRNNIPPPMNGYLFLIVHIIS